MAMDQETFSSLCEETARIFQTPDPACIARGEVFIVEGVECQLSYLRERGSALATFELGDPHPGTELELYRQLLEFQSMLVGRLDAAFVRDPINDTVLFTARLPLMDDLRADGLAESLRGLAGQVRSWKETVMQGKFLDYLALAEELMKADATAAPSTGRMQ